MQEPSRDHMADLRPVTMLTLDGGGVRGLSSLIILKRLLELTTEDLIETGHLARGSDTIRPQDVFDVAAGTSTGGLIVLMMVKLDMSVNECIQQYKILAKQIFSKQRPLLKRLFGSDWSKYSGRRLQKAIETLLKAKDLPLDLQMRSSTQKNSMRGTVLCHEGNRPHSIFFCTEHCQGPYQEYMLTYDLQMRHAARATSAAPSYFREMNIEERSFVDGGYGETNNPSWATEEHYRHDHNITCSRQIIMINIGTGTLPTLKDVEVTKPNKRPWWSRAIPNALIRAVGLVADLVHMATESENVARRLRHMSENNPEQLFFRRFSANTGVHNIQLDDWQAVKDGDGGLCRIEEKTQVYLADIDVFHEMRTVASKLTTVYRQRQEHSRTNSTSSSVNSKKTIDLSISLVVDPQSMNFQPVAVVREGSRRPFPPSLVSGTGATDSLPSSPQHTPQPRLVPPPITNVHIDSNVEALRGQEQQFATSKEAELAPSLARRLPARNRRAQTLPSPRHSLLED